MAKRRAVVEHQRQNGRQLSVCQLVALDQVLGQQTQIDQHAHGHPVVGFGLKFEPQIDPQPAILEPQAPDHVVVALLPVIGDIAGVDALQRREIGFGDPFARHTVAHQVAHHLRMQEEQLTMERRDDVEHPRK